ncbi:plasmid pRiA4b ORF-3 family protein [Pseudidiomarina sp. GXY010]|uniref:Plasmid pRiA4b ORF-3 family protein n=1 Tax=Pseudidiomarina fusca TaxID=2965078 RepID=A0ABU3KV81_9GAMM|nr:plasmid pRiA4b ORF-3 family protein [Pseudidiomarina sp. GXY010]MDT7525400.1 plasmid pRiA4b ORF-3 family protein [Pseudidiomarina sp. GXY010]
MAKYITLNINLEDAPYQVSRQLLVPAKIDLYRLHYYIQLAMGWTNSHLHMFKTAAGFFSNNDDPFDDPFDNEQPEIGAKLVAQLPRKGDSLLYVYDFGDDWRHTVTHGGSSIQPRHSSVKIIEAVGACPTEDSGGVAHMPERSSNKPNLAQIQQRLDQFIELTEQQAHDHDRAFAFVMGDQDALDETDGEDFLDEEALAAFIAADEAEEFNEDELTPERQQAFAELKLDMQKQAAQLLLQQIIANMHAQQRYQHVNEFINKPFTHTPMHLAPPPNELVAEAPIMKALLPLLQTMCDKPIKLTAAGYLPVAWVKHMWTELNSPDTPCIGKQQYEVPNSESKVTMVAAARHIMAQSSLVKANKTSLTITAKGKKLIASQALGEIYHELLKACLTTFHWGFVFGDQVCPLQRAVAPSVLAISHYLPQHEFPVNMLYDMTSTLIPALNEEPIPASAWRDDSDHSERQFYFAYRYLTLFGIFGIWQHQATNDYRRFDTQAYQVTVTDLGRSLLAP